MRVGKKRKICEYVGLTLFLWSKENQRSFQNPSSRWPVLSGKADCVDRAVFPNRGAKRMF